MKKQRVYQRISLGHELAITPVMEGITVLGDVVEFRYAPKICAPIFKSHKLDFDYGLKIFVILNFKLLLINLLSY